MKSIKLKLCEIIVFISYVPEISVAHDSCRMTHLFMPPHIKVGKHTDDDLFTRLNRCIYFHL